MVDIVVDFGGTFLARNGINKDIIQITDNRFVAVGIDISNILRVAIIDFTDFKTSDTHTVTLVKTLTTTNTDDAEQVYVQKLSSDKVVVFHGRTYIVLDILANDVTEVTRGTMTYDGTLNVSSNNITSPDCPHSSSFASKYIKDNVVFYIDDWNAGGIFYTMIYSLTYNPVNDSVTIVFESSMNVYTRSASIPKIFNFSVIDDNTFILNQLGQTSFSVVNYASYNDRLPRLYQLNGSDWGAINMTSITNGQMNLTYNLTRNEAYYLFSLSNIQKIRLNSNLAPNFSNIPQVALNQIISGSLNYFSNTSTRISNVINLDDIYYLVGYFNPRSSGLLWNAGYTLLKNVDDRWFQIEDYNNPSIGNIITRREAFTKFSNELVTFYGYITQVGSVMTFPIQRIYAPSI